MHADSRRTGTGGKPRAGTMPAFIDISPYNFPHPRGGRQRTPRFMDCDVEFEDEAFPAAPDKLEEDAIAQRQSAHTQREGMMHGPQKTALGWTTARGSMLRRR